MGFYRDEVDAVERAATALAQDLGFEHLHDKGEALWRFAIVGSLDRAKDHVPEFVHVNDRTLLSYDCFFPVLHLETKSELQIGFVTVLPANDRRIPEAVGKSPLDPEARSVVVVGTEGTDLGAMAVRGRLLAEHELRKLRSTLQATSRGIQTSQLRFKLGRAYAFTERLTGWRNGPGAAHKLVLNDTTLEAASSNPISGMNQIPTTDIEKKAEIALRWIERAQFADSNIVALLFLFFALEAILGDKSERLKAHGLAFRRAMLSHWSVQSFSHPDTTYFLYEQVRSNAVHGETVLEIDDMQLRNFAHDVNLALAQFLELARAENLTRRVQLRRHLEEHEDAAKLTDWLRENSNSDWDAFLTGESA
jgi:hypothetical protein